MVTLCGWRSLEPEFVAPAAVLLICFGTIESQFAASATVCLACTELPLAFPEFKTLPVFDYEGVSYINTTAVHINAVLDLAAQESRTSSYKFIATLLFV